MNPLSYTQADDVLLDVRPQCQSCGRSLRVDPPAPSPLPSRALTCCGGTCCVPCLSKGRGEGAEGAAVEGLAPCPLCGVECELAGLPVNYALGDFCEGRPELSFSVKVLLF